MLATMAPTLAAINASKPPLSRPGGSVARLALYQPPAALEQVRGFIGHLAAFFIQIAAFVERLAAHVADRFASLPRFLADVTACVLTGLGCIEQCDGRTERRPG